MDEIKKSGPIRMSTKTCLVIVGSGWPEVLQSLWSIHGVKEQFGRA